MNNLNLNVAYFSTRECIDEFLILDRNYSSNQNVKFKTGALTLSQGVKDIECVKFEKIN